MYLCGKAMVYPLECALVSPKSLLKQSANTHPGFSNLLWCGDLGICISNNCQGLSEDHTLREITIQPMRLRFTTLGYRKLLHCTKSECGAEAQFNIGLNMWANFFLLVLIFWIGESEKVRLKLKIQKTKIMASSPITSWQTDGETMETSEKLYFGGLQNHCRWWLQWWN